MVDGAWLLNYSRLLRSVDIVDFAEQTLSPSGVETLSHVARADLFQLQTLSLRTQPYAGHERAVCSFTDQTHHVFQV